jgi:hypothetical protein
MTVVQAALDATTARKGGVQCSVGLAYARLFHGEAAEFEEALRARDEKGWLYTSAQVAEALSNLTSLGVSEQSVKRHRRYHRVVRCVKG